ncbi:MAG: hypothetical protein CM1200mP3_12650 [Chloroflexota bacterium]|nr:MAG: hypothetical protein CM1200mP3_12650 [Chloroflexota bacterium]
MILLDSITRMTRAYNLSGFPVAVGLCREVWTLSLFIHLRNSLGRLETRRKGKLNYPCCLSCDTGSRLDDLVYEEFKGRGIWKFIWIGVWRKEECFLRWILLGVVRGGRSYSLWGGNP